MTTEQWKNRKFKPTQLPHHHYWEKTEITDKELWSSAFNAVASAFNSDSKAAVKWANIALDEWEKRKAKIKDDE